MKKIELTQGQITLVDDEDFDYLMQWKWYSNKNWNTYYAVTNIRLVAGGQQTKLKMHRLIMNVKDPVIHIDHIDGNGLHNWRSNLRRCNHAQNSANKRSLKNSLSKFLGVSYCKRDKRWTVTITKNRKSYWVGGFMTEDEAAKAYDLRAKEMHGEFANLNFKSNQ